MKTCNEERRFFLEIMFNRHRTMKKGLWMRVRLNLRFTSNSHCIVSKNLIKILSDIAMLRTQVYPFQRFKPFVNRIWTEKI